VHPIAYASATPTEHTAESAKRTMIAASPLPPRGGGAGAAVGLGGGFGTGPAKGTGQSARLPSSTRERARARRSREDVLPGGRVRPAARAGDDGRGALRRAARGGRSGSRRGAGARPRVRR